MSRTISEPWNGRDQIQLQSKHMTRTLWWVMLLLENEITPADWGNNPVTESRRGMIRNPSKLELESNKGCKLRAVNVKELRQYMTSWDPARGEQAKRIIWHLWGSQWGSLRSGPGDRSDFVDLREGFGENEFGIEKYSSVIYIMTLDSLRLIAVDLLVNLGRFK